MVLVPDLLEPVVAWWQRADWVLVGLVVYCGYYLGGVVGGAFWGVVYLGAAVGAPGLG